MVALLTHGSGMYGTGWHSNTLCPNYPIDFNTSLLLILKMKSRTYLKIDPHVLPTLCSYIASSISHQPTTDHTSKESI